MTLEDSIHAQRLRVLREAEQTGNVSATCRRYGWSRARFYELRQRFRQYGADGLRPKPVAGSPGRRPAPAGALALRMHPIRTIPLEPLPESIKQRPRHPMPPARLTDIAQPRGVPQHAQTLTVYAVLEGHRSRPFHVSPPRETRGRIGRMALVSSRRTDDSMCQH